LTCRRREQRRREAPEFDDLLVGLEDGNGEIRGGGRRPPRIDSLQREVEDDAALRLVAVAQRGDGRSNGKVDDVVAAMAHGGGENLFGSISC
jgi:hypothetical protein